MGTKIYLVPGFFGFNSLGALNYFRGVSSALATSLQRRGIEADIVECSTQPTGSIRNRSERVLSYMESTGGLEAEHLHFIGHSTGGLDVRLLVTPGVRLRSDDLEKSIGDRVRSVITVSTPHFGTPLANYFTSLQGRHLLQIMTLMATSNKGRLAIWAAAQLLSTVARLDDWMGRTETFLDTLSQRVLRQISLDQNDPVWAFLREIASDQGAIIQLTPEGMNLFNAAVVDRPGVDYRCVVTAAPAPIAHQLGELLSLRKAAMVGLFSLLYVLTTQEHRHYPYPSPVDALRDEVQASLSFALNTRTNDGVVPTLSQLYGEPIGVFEADHLDVVGQYARGDADRYADWMPSGAAFGDDDFVNLWDGVAEAIGASMAR